MNFIIYSRAIPLCKWCERAKADLKIAGHAVEVRDIGVPAHRQYFDAQGFKTVPQIYETDDKGSRHIGGYTDLTKWLNPDPCA